MTFICVIINGLNLLNQIYFLLFLLYLRNLQLLAYSAHEFIFLSIAYILLVIPSNKQASVKYVNNYHHIGPSFMIS